MGKDGERTEKKEKRRDFTRDKQIFDVHSLSPSLPLALVSSSSSSSFYTKTRDRKIEEELKAKSKILKRFGKE